ncbi:MAG: hypothetical protein JW757_02255 [Anaerolineales bacterium]|nr:hypothetical protein [Anaerolineales bacterium]
MNKARIFLTAFALLLVGLACSTFSGGSTNNSAPNGDDQTQIPTATPTISQPDQIEPQDEFLLEGLAPISYEEILEIGVETGYWTKEQGFITLLKYFLGEISEGQIPGTESLVERTATGVIRELQDFIQNTDLNPETRAELETLLRRILPPQDILEQTAERKGSSRPNTQGSSSPLANQQSQASCQEISILGYDEDDLSRMAGCYYYEEQTFQSSIFRIYYPFWWFGDGPYRTIIDTTFDALIESATQYANYNSLVIGDLNLIFPIENSGNTFGAQAYFDLESSACPLTMYPLAYEQLGEADYKQVVAHEMFHCIQDYSFPNTAPYSTHSWWLEGGADYFSNLVYPQTNLEWEFLDSFNQKSANQSIFDLDYENFVFFQFMGNKYSVQSLVDILQNVSAAGSQPGQQSVLSNVPEMETNFNLFVVEFLSSGVMDSGGGAITVGNPTMTDQKKIDKQGEFPFDTSPFVATRYKVEYEKEKRFLQDPVPGDGGSFSAAEFSGYQNIDNWSDLPPEVRSYCKEPLPYIFAVTTTGSGNYEFNANVTLAQTAVCDPCLLGVWAVDNDSFEEYILRIAEDAGPIEGGGELTLEVNGFNYLEFKDDARLITRRVDFAITTGVSSYDTTFTTVIDSQGSGTYSSDGEKIQVFKLADFVNSIYATVDGYPIAVSQTPSTGTYSFFGTTASGPGLNQDSAPENAGGAYVCDKETLTVTQPEYGPILFNRVDKIIPTPVPTPAAGNVTNP